MLKILIKLTKKISTCTQLIISYSTFKPQKSKPQFQEPLTRIHHYFTIQHIIICIISTDSSSHRSSFFFYLKQDGLLKCTTFITFSICFIVHKVCPEKKLTLSLDRLGPTMQTVQLQSEIVQVIHQQPESQVKSMTQPMLSFLFLRYRADDPKQKRSCKL